MKILGEKQKNYWKNYLIMNKVILEEIAIAFKQKGVKEFNGNNFILKIT